jgi:hypothetical protein
VEGSEKAMTKECFLISLKRKLLRLGKWLKRKVLPRECQANV